VKLIRLIFGAGLTAIQVVLFWSAMGLLNYHLILSAAFAKSVPNIQSWMLIILGLVFVCGVFGYLGLSVHSKGEAAWLLTTGGSLILGCGLTLILNYWMAHTMQFYVPTILYLESFGMLFIGCVCVITGVRLYQQPTKKQRRR